jgi:hypothetical protein
MQKIFKWGFRMKNRYQKLEEYSKTIDKGFNNIRLELKKIRHEIEHIKMNQNIRNSTVNSKSNLCN